MSFRFNVGRPANIISTAAGVGILKFVDNYGSSTAAERFKFHDYGADLSQMKLSGGNYKAPSYISTRRKGSRQTRKLATVASVKKMINGVMEKKQRAYAVQSSAMVSNTVYTYNLTAQIVQGTTDGARIGDGIELKNFVASFRYLTAPQGAYYSLRILVFFSGEEYNPSAIAFGAASFSAAEIMAAAGVNFVTAVTNPKAISVLHDVIIQVNSQVVGYEEGQVHRVNIPLNQKFLYQAAGSIQGKTKNLYMVVIPDFYTTNAAPPPNAGIIQVNGILNFTDA